MTLMTNLQCGSAHREGHFDESCTQNGEFRKNFEPFGGYLNSLSTEEFQRRILQIRHHRASDRLPLDPVPVFYNAEDWNVLSKGITQRARLWNALLQDIYGPQNVISKGILPQSLVFGNPRFLKSLWKAQGEFSRYVYLSAADVFRAPSGEFYVKSDFLQAPPRIGSALENRLAMVRAFPEIFKEMKTDRVALFFKGFRDALLHTTPVKNPRIVLISQGTGKLRDEDAELARYLSYPLVETEDLTIRGGILYLKTLAGLARVDVLFRRLEDDFCDPLELSVRGGEGTSGLVSAVFGGGVCVANALGSGAVEAAGFRLYLPELCNFLLHEELLLPSPPALLLTDKKNLDEVLASPEGFTFSPFLGVAPDEAHSGRNLTPAMKLSFMRELSAHPENWIAEKNIPVSTSPVFRGGKWFGGEVTSRLFCAVGSNGEYRLMPGGFASYAVKDGGQAFAGEKDIWVESAAPVSSFSLLTPKDAPVMITRAGGDLPSHAADNLFWLGRYMERVEYISREMRTVVFRLLERSGSELPELRPILNAIQGGTPCKDTIALEDQLWNFVLNSSVNGGFASIIERISRLSTQLRDRLTDDTWKILNQCTHALPSERNEPMLLFIALEELVRTGTMFGGSVADNFTRGHGWRFLEIGRRIERALQTLRLLSEVIGMDEANDEALLPALLEVGDATMTYMRRYNNRYQRAPVLDLFVCDETNPRSVIFQLDAIASECEKLPDSGAGEILREMRNLLLRISTDVRLLDVSELTSGNIQQYQDALHRLSDILSQEYLGHAPGSHQGITATEV